MILNIRIAFNTLIEINLEHMNITKCCVSSLEILCQALTAAAFNYCLFVASFIHSSPFSEDQK